MTSGFVASTQARGKGLRPGKYVLEADGEEVGVGGEERGRSLR